MSDRKAPPPTSGPYPRPTSSKPLFQSGSTSGALASGSGDSPALPTSLLTMFTKPTTEGYPAAEIIKYMIEVVGRDVVSFRRNTQVSFILVERARDLCDAINIHIKKTENGTDWASFEKFINALDPVEEALFKLVAFTGDEKTSHLVEGDSVKDCITSVNNWATNREELWTTLDHLETTTELTNLFSGVDVSSRQAEREEARTYDDETFFREVIDEIESSLPKSKLRNTVRTMTGLRELLDKISRGAIPPGVTAFTLKTGLLVQGVTKLAFQTSSRDRLTITHLRSEPVWVAAAHLVEILNSTRDDEDVSMGRVRMMYEEFLELLNNLIFKGKDLVPEVYMELLKLAGQVRRPFHSQAVALILFCRMLVTEFENGTYRFASSYSPPDKLVILERVLEDAFCALRHAVAAVTGLKIFNFVSFEDHSDDVFRRAMQTSIKKYDSIGVSYWYRWEQLIVDAIQKDKERMDQLNRLLDMRPPLTSQEQIELILEVYDRSTSTVLHQAILFVEGSTRLSAVRWTVARPATMMEESLRRRVRQSGEFWLLPEARCKLHDSVSQLAGNNKSLSLRLMV